MLNVPLGASKSDCKRAFHHLSKLLHPDKHPHATDGWKTRIEEALKLVNNANSADDLSGRAGGGGDSSESDADGSGSDDSEESQTAQRRAADQKRREKEAKRQEAERDTERNRLKRESAKTEYGIEASLMSRIVQTCENEVLSIVDRVFFDLGWDTLALVFDGLIVEPSSRCQNPAPLHGEGGALKKAEKACKAQGWDIKLAEKPLHWETTDDGKRECPPPRSVMAARAAMQELAAFEAQLS